MPGFTQPDGPRVDDVMLHDTCYPMNPLEAILGDVPT
jgi:hypothetical protein